MGRLRAGRILEDVGIWDESARAYELARTSLPIADYHLARLKMQQNQVDRAWELLERAVATVPGEVRHKVDDDREVWGSMADTERFRNLLRPSGQLPASAGR